MEWEAGYENEKLRCTSSDHVLCVSGTGQLRLRRGLDNHATSTASSTDFHHHYHILAEWCRQCSLRRHLAIYRRKAALDVEPWGRVAVEPLAEQRRNDFRDADRSRGRLF